MEQDLSILQNIYNTLKDDPFSNQRQLAKSSNLSLGMMNAILGRFVERGWIMLSNVNARKLAYAVTPEGIKELTERSKKFAKRTFQIVNKYNDDIYRIILNAKNQGKTKVVLFGKSYIRFLLCYIAEDLNLDFIEKNVQDVLSENVLLEDFCIVGELEEVEIQKTAIENGCVNLLDLIG